MTSAHTNANTNIITITDINTATPHSLTSPLPFPQFVHHMSYITSLIAQESSKQSLYHSDPTYLSPTSLATTEAIDHTLSLLSSIFLLPATVTPETEPPSPITILHQWVYDFNCGLDFIPGSFIDHKAPVSQPSFRAPSLSTLEELYDYLCYVYFRELNEAYVLYTPQEETDNA